MTEQGIDFHMIRHVFISHLHPDHVSDLAALIQTRVVVSAFNIVNQKLPKLQIYVGEAIYERTETLLRIFVDELSNVYDLVCIREGEYNTVGDFTLVVMKVKHGNVDAIRVKMGDKGRDNLRVHRRLRIY
jgi:ribonuclease BN (tRNA processing enzyme)